MAKKKRVKRIKPQVLRTDSYHKKIWFSFWTAVVFAAISIISLGLAVYIDPIKSKLAVASFGIIGILAGFIAMAFLVIWLIFLIMKIIKK
jgi:hypothetical protein